MDYERQIEDIKAQMNHLVVKDWLENDLFTAKWFGVIAFLLLCYAAFILLVDKKRTSKILLFGSLMAVASLVYEIFGTQFGYWLYIKRTVPTVPSIFIQSITVVPLTYMLVFQYGHTWVKFLILDAITTLLLCLGFLPIMQALKIYALSDGWSFIYNFPAWFVSPVVARALTLWWVNSEQKHQQKEAT